MVAIGLPWAALALWVLACLSGCTDWNAGAVQSAPQLLQAADAALVDAGSGSVGKSSETNGYVSWPSAESDATGSAHGGDSPDAVGAEDALADTAADGEGLDVDDADDAQQDAEIKVNPGLDGFLGDGGAGDGQSQDVVPGDSVVQDAGQLDGSQTDSGVSDLGGSDGAAVDGGGPDTQAGDGNGNELPVLVDVWTDSDGGSGDAVFGDALAGDAVSGDASGNDGAVLGDSSPSADVDPFCVGPGKAIGCMCFASKECASGLCTLGPDGTVCSHSCKNVDCPAGWACVSPAMVCKPPAAPDISAPDAQVDDSAIVDAGSTDANTGDSAVGDAFVGDSGDGGGLADGGIDAGAGDGSAVDGSVDGVPGDAQFTDSVETDGQFADVQDGSGDGGVSDVGDGFSSDIPNSDGGLADGGGADGGGADGGWVDGGWSDGQAGDFAVGDAGLPDVVVTDGSGVDGGAADGGWFDGGSVDGGFGDGGLSDGGWVDAFPWDAGADAGIVDGGIADGGAIDGGVLDGGSVDGGQVDVFPVDIGPLDAFDSGGDDSWNPDTCSDAAKYIHVVDGNGVLYRFNPQLQSNQAFIKVGPIGCAGGSPNSMAISRQGVAYLDMGTFVKGQWVCKSISKVSILDGSCQGTTAFQCGDLGFGQFGMGFSSNSPGSLDETLYIGSGDNSLVGSVDINTGSVAKVGPWPNLTPEFTGNAKAELWAFVPGQTSTVVQLDKTNAQVLTKYQLTQLPSLSQGNGYAYAFAFWGGDYYIFYFIQGVDNSTNVWKLKTDGSLTEFIHDTGLQVVGAGVSTCAPTVPPM